MTGNKEKKREKGWDDNGNDGNEVRVVGAMNKVGDGRRVLWTTSCGRDGRCCSLMITNTVWVVASTA
jgi:hypothetical protein